ncbi:hypothetical protein [Pseudoneobacillus sp. C159]
MSKTSTKKVSSTNMATKASKALQDGRTSNLTKSLAGSVLAQAKSKKR